MFTEDAGIGPCPWKEAIDHQLMRSGDDYGIEALVLADERGMTLASSGLDEDMGALLAAYAPLISASTQEHRSSLTRSIREQAPLTRGMHFTIRPFESNGDVFFLCALLTPDAKNNTALDRTLTRISPLIDN